MRAQIVVRARYAEDTLAAHLPRQYPVQAAGLIAHLVKRPIDRNHPLWELHVIEGLESGEVALPFKTHHSAADGASSMVMFS